MQYLFYFTFFPRRSRCVQKKRYKGKMSAEREIPAEDSIRVVCRFRPLNDSEERAGSKFIVKFPNNQEENCISIAVSI